MLHKTAWCAESDGQSHTLRVTANLGNHNAIAYPTKFGQNPSRLYCIRLNPRSKKHFVKNNF